MVRLIAQRDKRKPFRKLGRRAADNHIVETISDSRAALCVMSRHKAKRSGHGMKTLI